jgi:hypothetical protein
LGIVAACTGRLSESKNRSEKAAGRGQILTDSPAHGHSMGQEDGETWTGQALLQPISFKADRLLKSMRCARRAPGGACLEADGIDGLDGCAAGCALYGADVSGKTHPHVRAVRAGRWR